MPTAPIESSLSGSTGTLACGAGGVGEGGGLEDAEVGFFLAADPQAEPIDAFGVVPVVTAPGAPEEGPGFLPDLGDEGRGGGGRPSSVMWTPSPSFSFGSNQVDLGGR